MSKQDKSHANTELEINKYIRDEYKDKCECEIKWKIGSED